MIKQDISEIPVNICYLAIGSNLGNKVQNINMAKTLLEKASIKILNCSSFYLTPAWPNEKYPDFNNIVIKIKTRLKINALFLQIKKIEKRLGRIKNIKNSPRTCDIDIIDFNKKILKIKNKLTLPHKLMHKRNFVLIPFFEIQKNWHHPIIKKDLKSLISSLSQADIRSIKQI